MSDHEFMDELSAQLHERGFGLLDNIEQAVLQDGEDAIKVIDGIPFVNARIVYGVETSLAQSASLSEMLGGGLDSNVLDALIMVLHALTHRAADAVELEQVIVGPQDSTN